MPNPTIITIEHHGNRYTVEMPWDADVDDLRQAFRGLMFLMSFGIESIDEVIPLDQ